MRCMWVWFAFVSAAFLLGQQGGMVLVPAKLPQGDHAALTVTTFQLKTGAPAGGVPIEVELQSADGTKTARLFEGRTGPNGLVPVDFLVPKDLIGPAHVRVTAPWGEFKADTTVLQGPVILLETDKPMYQPGQRIQGRVLILNNELAPQGGTVEVVVTDGKGIRVWRNNLTVNEFGAAAWSLPLASELNEGSWKISASCGESRTELTVRVERYVLPQFSVDVTLQRDWFLPDEEITGELRSTYFFGKAVQGEATVVAERYVGVWEEYARVTVPVVDGGASFTLPAVGFAAGTTGEKGDSAVTLTISVTDTGQHSESTNRIVKIAQAPVEVRLVAGERSIKPGFPFSFLVITETPSGIPQDRTVSLSATFQGKGGVIDEKRESVATEGGEALVTYTVPEGALSVYIQAELTEEGHQSRSYLNIFGAYSPTASFVHLSREGSGEAAVGSEIVLTATTTHTGTLFWEAIQAGRVLIAGSTAGREIRFPATPAMMPSVKVVAYTLNPGNELACDALEVPVALDCPLDLEVSFSTEEARPGDPVTVTIQAHGRSLVGIRVVDESLLYLAGEQQTLRDLFRELEERYMAPQAEVHEDPWAPVPIPGPLEVFSEVGLSVGYSQDIKVPEGIQADPWLRWGPGEGRWLEDGVLVFFAPAPNEGGEGDYGNGLAEVRRLRQFFPETWVWEPLLVTDEQGKAQLALTCPDSITTWSLRALANSQEGIALSEDTLKVFQEFFVEPDLPVEVVRGEIFPLKLRVFNYASEGQTIVLELESSEWFTVEDPPGGSLFVEPNEVKALTIRLRPTAAGTFPLRVTARGPLSADAVQRNVRVVPEGVPFTTVTNGVLTEGEEVNFELSFPAEIVPDSGRIQVGITPSLVAQGMGNLNDLLGMPYGCGEQNMIFFAPDVEVLRYLQATGELHVEIQATAEHYINVGYQRELTFQRSDGSFSAFGEQDQEGSLYLTAFVLSTFAGARDVRDIDPGVLAQAASWLVERQKEDGSWEPVGFLHHRELLGGMGGTYALTAYVAKALAEYDPQSTASSLAGARAYLAAHRTEVADQAYPLAISAYALSLIPGAQQDLEATFQLLLALGKTDGNGMHWDPYPVETTAYAALALLEAGRIEASPAIDFLVSQRGAFGGFGSTQDTVVAFRALAEAALQARTAVNATIEVFIDDTLRHTFQVNDSTYDLLQTFELPQGRTAKLKMEGSGKVGYQIVRRYNLPGEELPPPRSFLIQVHYATDHVSVDDLLDVHVTLNYTGPREQTNMVIADVGVPTGFEAVPETLSALQEAGQVARIEQAVRKVIFYIPYLVRNEPLSFSFQVRALFPIRAQAVASVAYDYYEPDERGIDPGTGLQIGQVTFLRGDANDDGKRDLSDAVTVLEYLFAGRQLRCLDAADANDDGQVNVADPIFLLSYLFAGGRDIPEPGAEAGQDPTPDTLTCSP